MKHRAGGVRATTLPYRSGGQIADLKLAFLDHYQTIFHNFSNIPSMILVNTSFKSYDFACYKSDAPLCGKWNVFVPYNFKAAGNLPKVAEMLTLPTLAGFCEVLNVFLDVKCHISGRGLT